MLFQASADRRRAVLCTVVKFCAPTKMGKAGAPMVAGVPLAKRTGSVRPGTKPVAVDVVVVEAPAMPICSIQPEKIHGWQEFVLGGLHLDAWRF